MPFGIELASGRWRDLIARLWKLAEGAREGRDEEKALRMFLWETKELVALW